MGNHSSVATLNGCIFAGAVLGFLASRSLSGRKTSRKLTKKQRQQQSQHRAGKHTRKRVLGRSGLQVTVLGQGGASLGDLYVKLDNSAAMETLKAACDGGIGFFDTSPYYGVGLSEARFGVGLHHVPRASFVLQTKVGRFLVPDRAAKNGVDAGWIGGYHMRIKFDYSAAALVRQCEDSLQRMGLGYIDSLVIHDLEPTPHIVNGKTNGVAEAKAHLEVLSYSGVFFVCLYNSLSQPSFHPKTSNLNANPNRFFANPGLRNCKRCAARGKSELLAPALTATKGVKTRTSNVHGTKNSWPL